MSTPIKSAHRGFIAKIYLKDVPRIKKGYRQNFPLNPGNIKLPFMYDLIYSYTFTQPEFTIFLLWMSKLYVEII